MHWSLPASENLFWSQRVQPALSGSLSVSPIVPAGLHQKQGGRQQASARYQEKRCKGHMWHVPR